MSFFIYSYIKCFRGFALCIYSNCIFSSDLRFLIINNDGSNFIMGFNFYWPLEVYLWGILEKS